MWIMTTRALVHRADVRRTMLPMLTEDSPERVRSIRRRAVRFYRQLSGAQARAEEMYHRLMLGQSTRTLDQNWDPGAGAFLENALDELPAGSRVYLADRLGVTLDASTLSAADDEAWARQIAAPPAACSTTAARTAPFPSYENGRTGARGPRSQRSRSKRWRRPYPEAERPALRRHLGGDYLFTHRADSVSQLDRFVPFIHAHVRVPSRLASSRHLSPLASASKDGDNKTLPGVIRAGKPPGLL